MKFVVKVLPNTMHFDKCCPAGICTVIKPRFKVEGGRVTDVVVVQHETHIDG